VIIVTLLVVSACEWLFIQNGSQWHGILLGLSIALTIMMVYLPSRFIVQRVTLSGLIDALLIAFAWKSQVYVDEALLIGLAVSSFVAIRVHHRLGLWFYGVLLAGAILPVTLRYHSMHGLTTTIFAGVGLILILQQDEVALKFRQYRMLSIYDELTGLHNMRYFRHKMKQVFAHPKTTNVCLCLIDLDRFKTVNDFLGHREGDRVLRAAAKIIEAAASPAVVSRYGGEEFVILLRNTPMAQAFEKMESIRRHLEATSLCLLPITLSAGLAISGNDGSPDELFDAADRALYQAKESRNTVIVYHHDVDTEASSRETGTLQG
jgi:diguanylate cyclase (GGDEF)-like protein